MEKFPFPERLGHPAPRKYLHTAGKRSAKAAFIISELLPQERTLLQVHLLLQHEKGECIGCSRQGIPLDERGNDVPFRYEANGFASPAEFCDCPKGQQYQHECEQRRVRYKGERIREHLRFTRYLFGSACILPPVMADWTLESWPVDLEWPEDWEEEERNAVRRERNSLLESIHIYVRTLSLWDETSWKQGIALFGSPGVGKSGLLRCLEPLMQARGLSMISLYVPDLVVALESDQCEQMIAAIRGTDVVLFDNLGFLVPLGYKETQGRLALIRLLNARWERQQRTLITSNAMEEQLSEQLGDDSLSRLHGLCRFFEVPGVDLRRERK